ncbi:MAG TPA: SDR family NAD(P)-dependent oxidoreductase [Alphaproteobacteria bacterium]
MSFSLDGRVALVTGGAQGIGAAISTALAKAGAKVVIADNGTGIDGTGADPRIARGLADSLGASARAFVESVASPSAAQAAVDLAVKEFGGIDILVNNAAILRDALVFKGEPGDWDAVIRTNLSAPFYLIRAATSVMREQAKAGRGGNPYPWGRIINIGSTAGLYGNYGQASYGSAKAGLLGLTRVTALEMARSNVTCNLVLPFAHSRVTEMIKPANEQQAQYKERGMKVGPHHVATVVAYLCSPAAQKVSGQLIGVRGREVFLFSQPRPVARLVDTERDWTPDSLAPAVERELASSFTELATDLEAFNTEPVV